MTAEDSKRPPDAAESEALQCDSIGSPQLVASAVDRIRLLAQSRAERHPPNSISSPADAWPAPQPLVARLDRMPYPVDALPATIREAVSEIQGYTKAPLPLVASSALSAVSLACQAHVDVSRDAQLSGPTSLFMLAIADSGERKTSCDKHFMEVLEQYDAEQKEAAKPAVKAHKAELAAWEAKRDGMLSAMKDAAKKGNPTHSLEQQLNQLEQAKPERRWFLA